MTILRTSGTDEGKGGAINEIDAARVTSDTLLTAVRTQSGRLKLIQWQVSALGHVTRGVDSGDDGPLGSKFSIIAAGTTETGSGVDTPMVAVAYKPAESEALRLRLFGIGSQGIFTFNEAQDVGLTPGLIAWCSWNPPRLACNDGSGNLRIVGYEVVPNHGQILGPFIDAVGVTPESVAGDISLLATARVGAGRFVTALQGGHLKVVLWAPGSGEVAERLEDSEKQAGSVTLVSCAAPFGDPDQLVTAVRQMNGELKVVAWTTIGSVQRVAAQSEPGQIDRVGVAIGAEYWDFSPSYRAVTAVRGADKRLKLISWNIADGGVERLDDSGNQAGAIDLLRIVRMGSPKQFVTPVSDGNGNLNVVAWMVD